MTPGPTLIRRCLHCQGLLKQRNIRGRHGLRRPVWSDEALGAPMFPEASSLVACAHCRAVVWGPELEKVDSYASPMRYSQFFDTENKYEKEREEIRLKEILYEEVPFFEAPTEEQLFSYINSTSLPSNKELQVRGIAWRTGNDKRRTGTCDIPFSARETDNLARLVDLLNHHLDHEPVIRAEALRELGRMDEAKSLIETCTTPSAQDEVAQFILERILEGDTYVREITHDPDRQWRLLRRVRAQHEATIALPTHDLSGPPPFAITSRDWWFKVVGMLCHNWALIETEADGSVVVYFFHDQGKTRSGLPQYSGRQLRGRAAIVDSLPFSSVRQAERALRTNGFRRLEDDPGPWEGEQPTGIFFDARATEEGVYSRGEYWTHPN